MTWMAVAVGGAALVGAGSSYLGAKKQAKGAERGAQVNLDMFNTLNRQQQPFIQSGYGAMGKLNTLLGIGSRPSAANQSAFASSPQRNPQRMPIKQNPMVAGGAGGQIDPSQRLQNLLSLRASRGDTESARILQMMAG